MEVLALSGKTIRIWLDSARPKTLPAAVAPVVIGAAMAWDAGYWRWDVLGAILFSALCLQIGTNYANDYFDFIKGTDRADRVGPTRATAAGLVTSRQMLIATNLTFAFAALAGLYLVWVGRLPILLIGLASIASGVLYTAGPYPLGYVGLGDIFVLIFFGPVAVGGTYYLLTGSVNPQVIVAGLAPGLIATGVLVVNNVRDRQTDEVTGKRTLVVRFGHRFGVAEYAFCLFAAISIPGYLVGSTGTHGFSLLALLSLLPAAYLMRKMMLKPDATTLNTMLAQTGQLLIVYSVLFAVGWVL
jgi:1,4-dihydroxy-2-naphthoate octaprenyltransferase